MRKECSMPGGEGKERRILLICLGLSLLVMAAFCAIFFPVFETNDDQTMMHMIDGALGHTDVHLVFQHVWLGCLYQWLYRMNNAMPWYTLFQYALVAAALTAVSWSLVRWLGRRRGLLYALFVQLIIGYECYIQIQFTKTAGIAACAGMSLLLIYYRKKAGKKALIFGLVLLALGMMVRVMETAVVVLLSGPAWLCLLFACRDRQALWQSAKRMLLIALGAVVLCGSLYGINRAAYQSEEWQAYDRFNTVRSELLDEGMLDYEANREALEAMGIEDYAYNMFRGWAFADPEIFSTETLEAMHDMAEKESYFTGDKIRQFLTWVPKKLLRRERAVYLLLAFLLIWLLLSRHSIRDIFWSIVMFAGFAVMYYDLFVKGKYFLPRIDTAMFLAMSLSLVYMSRFRRGESVVLSLPDTDQGKSEEGLAVSRPGGDKGKSEEGLTVSSLGWKSRCLLWVPSAAVMVLTGLLMFSHATDRESVIYRGSAEAQNILEMRERSQAILEATAADTDHTYLSKISAIRDDSAYGPFDTAPYGVMSNILWIGGWSTWSPNYYYLMEQHGIVNPMRDAVDNPGVYLADDVIEMTRVYLERHMGCSITYEQVSEEETGISSVPIYRLYSDRGSVDAEALN